MKALKPKFAKSCKANKQSITNITEVNSKFGYFKWLETQDYPMKKIKSLTAKVQLEGRAQCYLRHKRINPGVWLPGHTQVEKYMSTPESYVQSHRDSCKISDCQGIWSCCQLAVNYMVIRPGILC